jgi:hypothetical protein
MADLFTSVGSCLVRLLYHFVPFHVSICHGCSSRVHQGET